MLILSRKVDEGIVIDGRILIRVVRIEPSAVSLGIQAPVEVPIYRHEIYARLEKNEENIPNGAPPRKP